MHVQPCYNASGSCSLADALVWHVLNRLDTRQQLARVRRHCCYTCCGCWQVGRTLQATLVQGNKQKCGYAAVADVATGMRELASLTRQFWSSISDVRQ